MQEHSTIRMSLYLLTCQTNRELMRGGREGYRSNNSAVVYKGHQSEGSSLSACFRAEAAAVV